MDGPGPVAQSAAHLTAIQQFAPRPGQITFVEIGDEIISTAILSLPLIQVGQLSVTGERICA